MKEETKLKFIHWAKAKTAVQENPELLLQKLDPVEYKKVVILCDQRTQDLFVAETALKEIIQDNSLRNIKEVLPIPYSRWINSKSNLPCITCWLSSKKTEHPVCEAKIQEYFDSEKALHEYVLNDML